MADTTQTLVLQIKALLKNKSDSEKYAILADVLKTNFVEYFNDRLQPTPLQQQCIEGVSKHNINIFEGKRQQGMTTFLNHAVAYHGSKYANENIVVVCRTLINIDDMRRSINDILGEKVSRIERHHIVLNNDSRILFTTYGSFDRFTKGMTFSYIVADLYEYVELVPFMSFIESLTVQKERIKRAIFANTSENDACFTSYKNMICEVFEEVNCNLRLHV